MISMNESLMDDNDNDNDNDFIEHKQIKIML